MKIGITLKKLLVYDQKPAATSLRHHSFNVITTYLKSRLANFPFGFEVLGKRFDARKELFHCNQKQKDIDLFTLQALFCLIKTIAFIFM